jgi:Stress responsive A/B Barrel Domain
MLLHVAVFRFQDACPREEIDELMAAIRAIPEDIDGVYEVFCGDNISPRAHGLTHVIAVRADDEAAVERYRAHPAHIRLKDVVDTSGGSDGPLPGIGADVRY